MENRLINKAIKIISKDVIGEETNLKILLFMLAGKFVKNKHPGSYNIIVNSTSGAGKDHLLKSIVKILPDEDYEIYSRISSRALDYLHATDKEFTWDNKFLILNDIEQEVLNGTTMKVFITEGVNTVIVDNGVSKINKVKGIPTLFITTAYSNPSTELLRRFNIINIDESEDQTKRIMKEKSDFSVDYSELIDDFNSLKKYNVSVPFWGKLVDELPCDDVFLRSFSIKIKDFIKASCVINQNYRELKNGKLIAISKDYENAKFIIDNFKKGKSFRPISKRVEYYLNLIIKYFGINFFTCSEFCCETGYSRSQSHNIINKLVESKYLNQQRIPDNYLENKFTVKYQFNNNINQKMPSVYSIFNSKTCKKTKHLNTINT